MTRLNTSASSKTSSRSVAPRHWDHRQRPRCRPTVEQLDYRLLLATVTSGIDGDPGSLRDVLASAPAGSYVYFDPTVATNDLNPALGPIEVTTANLTIDAWSGYPTSTIDGGGGPGLEIDAPGFSLDGTTVQNTNGTAIAFNGFGGLVQGVTFQNWVGTAVSCSGSGVTNQVSSSQFLYGQGVGVSLTGSGTTSSSIFSNTFDGIQGSGVVYNDAGTASLLINQFTDISGGGAIQSTFGYGGGEALTVEGTYFTNVNQVLSVTGNALSGPYAYSDVNFIGNDVFDSTPDSALVVYQGDDVYATLTYNEFVGDDGNEVEFFGGLFEVSQNTFAADSASGAYAIQITLDPNQAPIDGVDNNNFQGNFAGGVLVSGPTSEPGNSFLTGTVFIGYSSFTDNDGYLPQISVFGGYVTVDVANDNLTYNTGNYALEDEPSAPYSNLNVYQSTFNGNSGQLAGAFLAEPLPDSVVNVVNSTFFDNSALIGGAITVLALANDQLEYPGSTNLISDTIYENAASFAGGGVLYSPQGSNSTGLNINNSVVYANSAPYGAPDIYAVSPVTITYSDVSNWGGVNVVSMATDISADPGFTAPKTDPNGPGVYKEGLIYRPSDLSPVSTLGDPEVPLAPSYGGPFMTESLAETGESRSYPDVQYVMGAELPAQYVFMPPIPRYPIPISVGQASPASTVGAYIPLGPMGLADTDAPATPAAQSKPLSRWTPVVHLI